MTALWPVQKLTATGYGKLLRGDRGDKVALTILRGAAQQKQVTVTRDAIPLTSLDASYMLGNGVGYIKLE